MQVHRDSGDWQSDETDLIMAFINFDTAAAKLTQPTGWRAILSAVMAWVNGEIPSRRDLPVDKHVFEPAAESFDLLAPHLIDDSDIYIVDLPGGDLFRKVVNVAGAARSITSLDSVAAVVSRKMHNVHAKAILVINIDIIADMSDAVEQLLAVKIQLPFVPVVICSRTFAKNNFTLQRRAIADASLRLPCNDVSMALAIESAITNTRMLPH